MTDPRILVDLLRNTRPYRSLLRKLSQIEGSEPAGGAKEAQGKQLHLSNLHGSAPVVITQSIGTELHKVVLCIATEEDDAGYLYNDFCTLYGGEEKSEGKVFFFPSLYRRGIRFGQADGANEILRSQLIEHLSHGTPEPPTFIVTYPEALLEGIVEAEEYAKGRLTIKPGDIAKRKELREKLWAMGFEETDYVYTPGQFAVRGSLFDIYSFANETPVRIDFFGDEVESIRTFDPEDQLSLDDLKEITILSSFRPNERSQHASLLSLLPDESLIYIDRLEYLLPSLNTIYNTAPVHGEDNVFDSLESMQKILVSPDDLYMSVAAHTILTCAPLPQGHKGTEIDFHQSPEPLFHKRFDILSDNIIDFKSRGYRTFIMSSQASQIKRLNAIFTDQGRGVTFDPLSPTLHKGFIDNSAKVVCFTDHTIFERFHKYTLKRDQIRNNGATLTLKELQKLEYGDYVVHLNHGVGIFAGLFTIEQNGKKQECVRINYKGGDSIYVSIHALHHISKYKSKDNEAPPQLNKLGTGAWERLKDRTKKKIKDIARDLIRLYAKRLEEKGFAYSPDTYLQKELEASFMYEDTPDQELATAQVKEDMEKPVPMDRLICGDVGFGKTEIAIRAAFKAVADNKQVAVLVPTTVLAYQHFLSFQKRLKEFPCRVEYLSRAKTTKQRNEILEDLASGKIDIIIGTHALANPKIKYHDLGLLIIDEEQKFGVAVKERLRKYRTHIDTLTMTATPIPRTLQFSLMGARDMSNIQTPPPNRHPVRTIHSTFEIEAIADAINFELARDGQVFFVHNRIHNLNDVAHAIRQAVPDVRIAVGHGQMDPKALETLLLDFLNHEYDVLLTTSIVENGIDVPNANTIIINDAQRFGLSDLHQLRGRVGRGQRKAYCYLLTPPLEVLTPDAKRRIKGITTFSELGSGIHIAMQDLDIRGAGNLLGAEQSGFIADLGYDAYRKILEEAVEELKYDEFSDVFNDENASTPTPFQDAHRQDQSAPDTNRSTAESIRQRQGFVQDTTIETDLEAYFPPDYVPGDDERIILYRELDELKEESDILAYRNRLLDRFGELPPQADELLGLMRLRLLGKKLGIEKIVFKNNKLLLNLVSDFNHAYYHSATFANLLANATTYGRDLSFNEAKGRRTIVVRNVPNISAAETLLNNLRYGHH